MSVLSFATVSFVIMYLSNVKISDISKDLMGLLLSLKDMLIDKKVSADGRDNAISLIAKNVPRRDIRRGNNARTMTFLEVGGWSIN